MRYFTNNINRSSKMESVENALIKYIEELSECELNELQILYAKFNNSLMQSYNEKIQAIQNNIDSQLSYYGKIEDYQSEKEEILNKYSNEFQKIYDQRNLQFVNILSEIQEIQSNQKIALVNFEIIAKKMKEDIDDEVFDSYDKKLEALVTKYDGYEAIILECKKKMDECLESAKDDFDNIVKYRNENLAVTVKSNFIIEFINKLLSKFLGKSKFKTQVVEKMNDELLDIEKENNETVEIINEQTINLISKIEEVRDQINLEFKVATE